MKKIQFIKESLKSLKEVGTILPSSKSIVNKMIQPIDFSNNITIIELGSGTGVITKKILDKMNSKSNLICFETNKKFYEELKKIDNKKMTLLNQSAELMESYLNDNEIIKIDYIVSSVPLVTLPKKVTNNILEKSAKILNKHGELIQLQYSKLLKKRLEKHFNTINTKFTAAYYLPAFIYICSNK